jgi:hypothetical protein
MDKIQPGNKERNAKEQKKNKKEIKNCTPTTCLGHTFPGMEYPFHLSHGKGAPVSNPYSLSIRRRNTMLSE